MGGFARPPSPAPHPCPTLAAAVRAPRGGRPRGRLGHLSGRLRLLPSPLQHSTYAAAASRPHPLHILAPGYPRQHSRQVTPRLSCVASVCCRSPPRGRQCHGAGRLVAAAVRRLPGTRLPVAWQRFTGDRLSAGHCSRPWGRGDTTLSPADRLAASLVCPAHCRGLAGTGGGPAEGWHGHATPGHRIPQSSPNPSAIHAAASRGRCSTNVPEPAHAAPGTK